MKFGIKKQKNNEIEAIGKDNLWFQTLSLIERLNRSVKEPGWAIEDKELVYKLKDEFIDKLLIEKPKECKITLYYVPYLRYSEHTKDIAGELMRKDGKKYSFDYYLEQVEPTSADVEDPLKATVEMVIECNDQNFSLHMPVEKLPNEYNANELPRKKWIPTAEFHHIQLKNAQEQYCQLLKQIARFNA